MLKSIWIFGLLGLLILGAAGSAEAIDFYAPKSKVGGEVIAHREFKQSQVEKSVAARGKALRAAGLNPENVDREDCALYVQAPLSAGEIKSLKGQGIDVHPTWVPPVPGHHPYGFYLATVQFTALDTVRADARIVLLETTERANRPMNNAANAATNADDVQAGNGITAATGAGVTVAVADSGVDLTHPDLPTPVEAYDMTDGTNPGTWGTSVANLVDDHGTHVVGTVLGRGTNSVGRPGGAFVGAAPGASLAFYKIGNDTDASSLSSDEIEAINRAAAIGAKVFTMSYGGYDTFMDGSGATEQAIDAAVTGGMTVFVSAGNEAANAKHASVTVAPSTSSGVISFTITNSTGATITGTSSMSVIWRDGNPGDGNLTLSCTNLGGSETLTSSFSSSSVRGTDTRRYTLGYQVAASSSKTYQLQLTNGAATGTSPLVHLYCVSGPGRFDTPDPQYTISSPALADKAIAVGAWVHRNNWVNWQGTTFSFGQTLNSRASFSNRGPRIDGTLKPDIMAPGSGMISLRDSAVPESSNSLLIDDDGSNDSTGPTTYCVKQGTSMASPHAAGVAALMYQAKPTATTTEIRNALTSTASLGASPNNDLGYGLIDAFQAVLTVPVELSAFGTE